MSVGILILSTEKGKNTATMIGADKGDMKELGEAFTLPACTFIDIGQQPKATNYLARAWQVIEEGWNKNNEH